MSATKSIANGASAPAGSEPPRTLGILDATFLGEVATEAGLDAGIARVERVNPFPEGGLSVTVSFGERETRLVQVAIDEKAPREARPRIRGVFRPGEDPLLPRLPLGSVDRELRESLRRAAAALGIPVRDGEPRGALLAHRLGRRLSVRYTWGGHEIVAKAMRPGRAVRLAARIGEIGRGPSKVPCPPVHADPEREVVYFRYVPGRTLHELLPNPIGGAPVLVAAVSAAGAALSSVHAAPVPPGAKIRSPADAVRAIERPVGILESLHAGDVPILRALLGRAAHEGGAVRPARASLAHGDFYDRQVVLLGSPPRATIVDWDLVAGAHPAEDVANFVAHLRLRSLQGVLTPRAAVQLERTFDAAYGFPLDAAARTCFLAASLLRLAAVYSLRPRWRALSTTIRLEAAKILDAPGA